jgi:hypothetical protein
MDAGWGAAFVERFHRDYDDAIATVLTRDNREFLARHGEIEILPTFPTAWRVNGTTFIPEVEIVRVDVTGALKDDE